MPATLRRRLAGRALALLAFTAAPASLAAQHFPSNDSLTALLRARVGDKGIGMVLGVLEADGTTRIVSHGSAGLDAKHPLGVKSLFELGSITKVFTGILLADLVEQGKLSLDDPVAKHVPANVKVPARGGRQITLVDLATHRSSLTRMPTNMVADGANPYPNYTIADLYAFLGAHQLRRDIGAEYEYSNIAVALLGHVLERVSGKPYEELVQERILRPLGMSMTSTKVEGPRAEWMTVGHDERGLVAAYRGWAELPAMGALRSNAEDMLKFLAANIAAANGDSTTPTKRAMRRSHVVRNSINASADIGLNWNVMKFGDRRVIAHGGATQGFRAFAAFDPAAKVGVVLLANYPAAGTDLALHLLNPKVPLAGAAVAERTEVDVSPEILRSYVGDYEMRPDFSINVTLDNGALFAQATGQNRLPIFAESESRFFYKTVNAQLAFTRDAAGKVTGVVLHQNGRELPGRRRSAPGVPLASAAELAAALPGRKASVPSRRLGGDRAVRVVVPRGYEMSQSSRYPVLYVVDGERPLHAASSVAGTMAQAQNAPEMIVVHVAAPAAAERAAFVRFLAEELKPWVEREYRTASLGVLAGTADLLDATRDFPAEIALGATGARASFRNQSQPASATAPAEPHAALGESLKWLFDGFAMPQMRAALEEPGGAGWAKVEAHYKRLSDRYGYTVVPPEAVVDQIAMSMGGARRFDDAIRLLEKNRELHPGSAVTWNHLGDAFRVVCRWPEAKQHYAKAHELAQAMSYANVSNYAMELSRITQEMESGKQCTAPGATRPSVSVPASVLRTYAGEYALSPRVAIVVTFESDTLYAQPTGEQKRAMRGLSETRFFMDGSSVELSFVKDAAGAVTGMTVHQGARDMPARKVK